MRIGIAFVLILVGRNSESLLVHAEILGWNVVFVPDGDGFIIESPKTGIQYTTRLCGIDCPELGQPMELKAKNRLQMILHRNRYRLYVYHKRDLHSRLVVSLIEEDGCIDGVCPDPIQSIQPSQIHWKTVSSLLVAEGLCQVYRPYVTRCIESSDIYHAEAHWNQIKSRNLLDREILNQDGIQYLSNSRRGLISPPLDSMRSRSGIHHQDPICILNKTVESKASDSIQSRSRIGSRRLLESQSQRYPSVIPRQIAPWNYRRTIERIHGKEYIKTTKHLRFH